MSFGQRGVVRPDPAFVGAAAGEPQRRRRSFWLALLVALTSAAVGAFMGAALLSLIPSINPQRVGLALTLTVTAVSVVPSLVVILTILLSILDGVFRRGAGGHPIVAALLCGVANAAVYSGFHQLFGVKGPLIFMVALVIVPAAIAGWTFQTIRRG